MKQVFVIVPSFVPDGPMKGAVALCNGLAGRCGVRIVSINGCSRSVENEISPEVEKVRLENYSKWKDKVGRMRDEVRKAGSSGSVTLISYSLKADILNLAVREQARHISSVRGNLLKNYRYDYGWKGAAAALVHFQLMRLFDIVVSMSDSMTGQLRRYGIRRIIKIGNFLDERNIQRPTGSVIRSSGDVRFVFLGSLTERKRPELAVNAVLESNKRGGRCRLDMVGEGPLRGHLEALINSSGAGGFITLHGYVRRPYGILQDCDYMMLPSETEGVSRAVMESLYYGVPCILRDVDASREIIHEGENGHLFRRDREFVELVCRISGSRKNVRSDMSSLLPEDYRQLNCISRYMEILA